jgi:mRNA interferase RelE/StbE
MYTRVGSLEVKATPRFERMLKRLPVATQRIVLSRANELSANPYLGRRLAGELRGLYSLRVGNFRVIYYIDSAKDVVWLVGVGSRERVYE